MEKGHPIYDSRSENTYDNAGSRMAEAFESCGKQRTDFDIAEAVCCFPGKQKDLNHHEVVCASTYCRKYLYEYVSEKQYSKIVCWGNIAYTISLYFC